MKQKKFSQIYREAAELVFDNKRVKRGVCAAISIAEGNFMISYYTKAQNYFHSIFTINGNREMNYFGDRDNQDCINHRITALLLASEIAKSEGL